jgi:F0F1-type ATP synthase assembly protein I
MLYYFLNWAITPAGPFRLKNRERAPSRGDKMPGLWAQAAYYASLSLIIPGASAAGYLAGWYLDRYTGLSSVLAIVGAIAGFASGIAEVLQIIARAERHANSPNDRTRS